VGLGRPSGPRGIDLWYPKSLRQMRSKSSPSTRKESSACPGPAPGYHGGCDQVSACASEKRVCADAHELLLADLQSGTSAVLEWEAPDTVVGVRTYYYFVEADGRGDYYFEKRTDIADSDCDSYCGWHRESYSPGELFDGTSLHLSPSGHEIEDVEACGWP